VEALKAVRAFLHTGTYWPGYGSCRAYVCCCLGFGLSAFFFFGLAMVVNGIQAVAFLTVAVGLSGIAISGTVVCQLFH